MGQKRTDERPGLARIGRERPLLALLSTGLLVAAVACNAAPRTGEQPPESTTPSDQEGAAGGEPVQYPPGKPKEPPVSPEEITPVPVEARVEEGQASHRTQGDSQGLELRSFEVPVSLGTGPAGSSPESELLETGLDGEAVGDGVALVAAGNRRAEGPGGEAELVDGGLSVRPAGGADPVVVRVSRILGADGAGVDGITLANDPFAGRFLLLALESAPGPETTRAGPRILLAVSGGTDPAGAWHLAAIGPAEVSEGGGRIERLEGLAVSADVVFVVVREAGDGEEQRRRVYSIDKGPGTSGFYAGETASVRVH